MDGSFAFGLLDLGMNQALETGDRVAIKNAQGDRRLQAYEHGRQGLVGLVVNQQVGYRDALLSDGHRFEFDGAGLEPEAAFPILSEDQGAAMADVNLFIVRHVPVGEIGEDLVVVNDAVLEDLDERGADVP